MRQVIEAAKKLNLPARVKDGECLVSLPCSEWIRLRMIDGYSQFHLTASKCVDELLTKTYDLQPTKAGYYLVDEDTASAFVSMLPDCIVTPAVAKCKDSIADLASRLKSMESSEQRSERVKRIGQDKLRQLLLATIGACEITGVQNRDLLVVSHIKSWEDCVDGGAERLDQENVLLLAKNYDALFDRHYISFDPNTGKLIVSKRISGDTLRAFGVPCNISGIGIGKPSTRRAAYLRWHLEIMDNSDRQSLHTKDNP